MHLGNTCNPRGAAAHLEKPHAATRNHAPRKTQSSIAHVAAINHPPLNLNG